MVLTCGILAGCPLEDIIVTELRDASSHTVVKGVFPADAELVDDDRHIPDDTGRDFLNMIPDEEYKKAAQEIFMKGRNNLKRLNEICAIRSISILHKSDKTPFVPSDKVRMEVRPEYYFQILKDNPNYYTDFVVFQDKGGAMLERIPCTYDIETGILSFETTLPSKNHFSRPLTNDYFRNNFFVMPALRGRMVTAELYGSIRQINDDGSIQNIVEASPNSPQSYALDKFIPGPNAGKTFSPDEPEQYAGYNATVKLEAYSKNAAYKFMGWYIEKVDFEIQASDMYMDNCTRKARDAGSSNYEVLIHDSVIEVNMTDYMSYVIVALFDLDATNIEKISLSSGESGLLDNSDEPLDDKIIHLTTEDKDRIDLNKINIYQHVNIDGVLVKLGPTHPWNYAANIIDDGGLSSWEIGTYTVTINHPYNHELKASFTVEISEKLYDFTAGVVNQGTGHYSSDLTYTQGYIQVDGYTYDHSDNYRAKLRKGEQVVVRAWIEVMESSSYEFFTGWYKEKTFPEDSDILFHNYEYVFTAGESDYNEIYAAFISLDEYRNYYLKAFIDEKDRDKGYFTISYPYDQDRPEYHPWTEEENVGFYFAKVFDRNIDQYRVRLRAEANEGYRFVGWRNECKDEIISTDAVYEYYTSYWDSQTDVYLKPIFEFEEEPVSFSAWVSGNGYLEVNGENIGDRYEQYLPKGKSVTVKAVANQGYVFVGWNAIGPNQQSIVVTENPEYTFTAGESQYNNVFAVFEEEQTFSFSAYANRDYGYLEVDGENVGELYAQEALPKGTSVTVKAVANQGYVFVCWNAIGPNQQSIVVTENPEYTFTAGESQYDRVFAVFEEEQTFSFSAWVSGNGYLEVNGENIGPDYFVESLRQGEQVTVKAIPAEGFRFVGWFAPYDENQQEVLVTENPEYTFTAGESQYDRVFARLEEEPTFSFSAWVSGEAYLEVNGENVGPDYAVENLRQGEQVTVKAIPYEGFSFVGWFAYDENQQEVLVTENPEYTFTAGESQYNNVFARTEREQTFSFSAWVSGNGYLEVNGENIGPDYAVRSLRQGEQVTVKAIPAEGFRFVGWFAYDGNQQEVPVTEDPEYTFTAGESPYNNVFARLEEEQAEQPEQNDLGKAFASDIRTMPAALKFDAVCLREKD